MLDRAHKLGIRFTDISEDSIKSKIREAEEVLRERRQENIKLVLIAVVGLVLGVAIMAAIAKVLGW